MSSQIQRRVRATVRLEVMFDLPDEWSDERIEFMNDAEGRAFLEMLDEAAAGAIRRGDVLDSEIDNWDYV